jgi:uncharacterized protein (DUF2141 family)
MRPRSCFIICFSLLLLTFSYRAHAQGQNCRKIEHTVKINDASNGTNGSITVKAKNSSEPFTVHLVGKGRGTKSNQEKVSTGTIENIKPGKYDLVILYENGDYCTETRKVTVN